MQLDDIIEEYDEDKVFYISSCDELVLTLNQLLGQIPKINFKYKGLKKIYDGA